MEIRELRYFVTLATKRTLSETAAYLQSSETEVRAILRHLETKHGRLFERDGGNYTLNSAGWELYYRAINLLSQSAETTTSQLRTISSSPSPTADARPVVSPPRAASPTADARPTLSRPTDRPKPAVGPRPQPPRPELELDTPSVILRRQEVRTQSGPKREDLAEAPATPTDPPEEEKPKFFRLATKPLVGQVPEAPPVPDTPKGPVKQLRFLRHIEELRVGMIPSVCAYMARRLTRSIRQERPQTELMLLEDEPDTLLRLCHRGDIQFAIGALPPGDDSVEAYRFYLEHLMVLVSHDHPLAGATSLHAADLQPHCVIMPANASPLNREVDQYFLDHGIDPRVVAQTSHLYTVLSLVGSNHGIAILPELACRCEAAGDYVAIPLDPSPPLRTLAMYWTAGTILPPPALWLVNWISQSFRDIPRGDGS